MAAKKDIIIILILSIAVHFAFFGHPNETVFDEVHFGKFVSGYYTGEYYFDIHPPLGKLMLAGFAKIFDFQPEFSFAQIGEEFPDKKYMALRFLPMLAGTLLPLVIFFLILELGMNRIAAFVGGLLIVFENAILVQSRLILLDSFLLLFGFLSLLFYFKKKYLLMAVFAGLAISIKWTALSFIALPMLIEGFDKLKERRLTNFTYVGFVRHLAKFCSFFLISLVIYFSVFALHFILLTKPGPGDDFMKPSFRKNNIIRNIWDVNFEMYRSNQRLSATHPYSSQWYEWPIARKSIFYWVRDNAKIYLQGNPVVWFSSTVAATIGLWSMVYGLWFKKKWLNGHRPLSHSPLAILVVGYWLNLLPFIGVKRVMFLYHYLIPLIFAILMLCYLIDRNKNSRKIFAGLVIASIAAFLYFAPLTYGLSWQ